ncbi:EutN/CcmL family microcompartment protein [Evansella clarkii]|uniref:EutN/CcmL family microcompartment protein n=1 Tax=Evansella clarkii TaxID=79879 RepID=UPI000B43EC53|nr:EutN/CcmL family microcompartment protein [Evansella clarkii]
MIIAEVIGNIWATRKENNLTGLKFLIVKEDSPETNAELSKFVAVDRIGAGVGDKVLITRGSSASVISEEERIPIDALIIGIIDSVEVERGAGNG